MHHSFTELDIAILRLLEDAPIGKDVYPAQLPRHKQDQFVGEKVQVGSWGNLAINKGGNQKLTIFNTTVVHHADCNLLWGKKIPQSDLCTQVEKETGLELGDSGGINITTKIVILHSRQN